MRGVRKCDRRMKLNKGRIIIYGDTFRNNAVARNIFAKSEYDDEQDEYFIVFNTMEDRNKIIGELCNNKIVYRLSSELDPVWTSKII